MALSERSRSVLYQGLITIVDDEQAVQEMMSYFPARDGKRTRMKASQ